MKQKRLFVALISVVFAVMAGCTESQSVIPTSTLSPTKTSTPTPTQTPSPTITNTLTPTITITPSPTPTPQTIGRIFPEGFDSPGIWSNDWDSKYPDRLHFDIGLPYNLVTGKDYVLSPLNGQIIQIYEPNPDEGKVIDIRATLPINGLDEFIKTKGYMSSQIVEVRFYIAHVNPLVTSGKVIIGEPIATAFDGWWSVNKIGFVFTITFKNGDSFQFSPCELPNNTEFCGKCYPQTPLSCP